jgi:amino-acid N-acetyltransferase
LTSDIEIRPARASDLATATAWLESADLPTEDLTAAHMESFLFAHQGDTPVGMIGLEPYADCGLLRSLYVDAALRGSGVGAHLVSALEEKAAGSGVDAIWLLTIDADAFFTRQGYEVMQRGAAPASIQSSAEFSSLCPGDAVLMQKRLVET